MSDKDNKSFSREPEVSADPACASGSRLNTPPHHLSLITHHSSLITSSSRLGRLARKELSEILRDRRTILTLVLMPLLLYPLLTLTFQQFFLASGLSQARGMEYKLGFSTKEEFEIFYSLIPSHKEEQPPQAQPSPDAQKAKQPSVVPSYVGLDLEEKLRERAIDLGVRIRKLVPVRGQHQQPDVALDCELLFLEGSVAGLNALEILERQLATENRRNLAKRLGLPGPPVVLVQAARTQVASPEGSGFLSLAALVPLVLILMTITGAVYPAIDLTAGERERGTLEILVAAPVPRLTLLFAKYVAVVTVAVLTALINLATMTATVMVSGLGPFLFGDRGVSLDVIIPLFGLLLLFAAFFSAVLLVFTSFARSFKEAQAYLIPLMLASLGPGLVGMLPGLKLSGPLVVVPLVNIVLLGRDLFEGSADAATAAIVVLATVLYALAALATAARIFGAEGVLYQEQTSWSELIRRPREEEPTATLSGGLTCFALLFSASFMLQGALAHVPAASRLAWQVAASVALFVGLPWFGAWWRRVSVRTAFQLHLAPWWWFLLAGLGGLALVPVIHGLLIGMRYLGWTMLGPEQEQQLAELVGQWRTQPALVAAGSFALMGVAEEWFFRGFLFSALRRQSGALTTILVSAALFGLFHFAPFDRLLPSTLLGVVLGWLCWKSGSVWPGMLLHAVYNAAWVLRAYYAG